MLRFLIRRLVHLVVVLLGGFTIMFALFFALPDDPAVVLAGGNARAVNEQVIENTRIRFGLDKPLYEQYVLRLKDTVLLRSESFKSKEPVREMLSERLPNSIRLAFWAVVIETVVGIGTGVLSARRRNSAADWLTTTGTVVLSAVPVFVLAYLLKQITGVYANQHDISWLRLPTQSNPREGSWYLWLIPDRAQLRQLVQPAIVLATVSTAVIARLTRTTMLEAASSEHVRTARAKGLTERLIARRHTLRNALIPVVTYIGIDIGTLVGSAILTETVFGWPGLGSKIANAAAERDLPVMLTLSMAVIFVYGLTSLLVDVLYAWLDPRIRLEDAR